MSVDTLKDEFVAKYLQEGEQKFYRFLLVRALNKLVAIERQLYKGEAPNLELLSYYDRFIISYRREGEEAHLQMARLFRKAGHKVYRIMLRKQMTQINPKFLNLV
jgi:hypothetical protein